MTPGTQVIIRTGAWGGTRGVVVDVRPSISQRTIIDVRLTVPVLIAEPDGPTREVVLQYAPAELEVATTTGHVISDTEDCWCEPTIVKVEGK